MIRLFTAVFGRLAFILTAQAATAWLLTTLLNSIAERPVTVVSIVITIFVMIITIFMYQEKRLGANITWLTTLPLAKRSVWLLSYVARFAAIVLALGLLCLLSVLTPDLSSSEREPILYQIFGELWKSFAVWASFFGIKLPGLGSEPTISKSIFFVTVAALCHFYCSMIRFMSGRLRIVSVVLLFIAGWIGFLMLAAYGSSLFLFELFLMTTASIVSLVIAKKELQISFKSVMPIAGIVIGGWLLLLLPQAGHSLKHIKNPNTVDEFVDGYEFFGKMIRPTQEEFANAFSKPGNSWPISRLAKHYTRHEGWGDAPGLDPHGDPAFEFVTMVKAQKNYDSAFGVLAVVKLHSLTATDIAEFSQHVEALEPAREANSNYLATLMQLELSDEQFRQWLGARSPDLKAAAIVYPRFHPSDTKWAALAKAYRDEGSRNSYVANMFRITASVISGSWLSEEQTKTLANADIIPKRVDRSICTSEMRRTLCEAVTNCGQVATPEAESCYFGRGIDSGVLNTCLYTLTSQYGAHSDTAQLITAGWATLHDRNAYFVPRIVCD